MRLRARRTGKVGMGRRQCKSGLAVWVVGIFGFSAAAIAQTLPSSTVGTRFDGTYVFVSSSKVNETYTSHITEHIQRCLDRSPPRPLVIVNGHARLLRYGGTVGAQGEFLMQRDPEPWGRGPAHRSVLR